MPTYQDPSTIQRQAAPTTGDLYAQPEKPPKQPPGPASVYSQVDKPQVSKVTIIMIMCVLVGTHE